MLRAFRYPLRPREDQVPTLLKWLGICCDLYNSALQEKSDAWRISRKNISRYDQQKELTEVRAADLEIASTPVEVERSALARVDRAFKAFFQRCKNKQSPGYPRYRSRQRYRSFSFPFTSVNGNRLHVPSLGAVRFHRYRQIEGTPLEVTIGRESAGKWYVSFSCDLGPSPAKVPVQAIAGIDLGLTNFATLSDGSEVPNPRFFRVEKLLLSGRQRTLSRRQKGSKSYERQKILVAKTHQRIVNRRMDFFRKLSHVLFQKYDLIVHEDLTIERMSRGWVGKSIKETAWGTFLRCLASKAESAGKHNIAVDSMMTTQICSSCGSIVRKSLSERTHRCSCGSLLGRDHNAALNILRLGKSQVEVKKFLTVETEGKRAQYPIIPSEPTPYQR